MASQHFDQVGHQALRDPRPSPPQLQTQGLNPHPRFSYMETPAQLSNAHFEQFSSPTNSTIDESPTSAVTQQWTLQHDGQSRSPYPEEKALPSRSTSPYNFPPPQGLHPALSAPYADTESPVQPRSPSYQMSMLSPRPYSPGHELAKKPVDLKPPQRTLNAAPDSDPIKEPRLNPLTKTPTYNPNSPVGPNATSETHRPGQVSHPNSVVEPEWKHGLCEVDTTCCIGLFCPCMLYGKTQYRLSQKSKKGEATDLLGYENCNGPCTFMALACGFQCKPSLHPVHPVDVSLIN